MDDTENALSAEDKAYFDSRGEVSAEPEAVELDADEAEIAAEDEAAPEADEQPQKPKTVPLAKLLEERKALKKYRAEAEETARKLAVFEDRFQTMQRLAAAEEARQTQAPVDDDPEPDKNVDLWAWADWTKRQLAKTQEKIAARERYEAEQHELQQAEQMVWGRWRADSAAYAQENPEFGKAAEFLAKMQVERMKAIGIMDDATHNATINAELRRLVSIAGQNEQNAARMVFNLAVASGFNPESAKSVAKQVADATGGAPAAPSPDLAKLGKAAEAATSLSAAGGGRAPVTTAESIADMSDKDFEAWISKPGNLDKWKRAAGSTR